MGRLIVKKGMMFCAAILVLLFIVPDIQADEPSRPLKLEHADRLIGVGGDRDIINLVGNVHLSHEDVDIFSDRATWYRKSGLVQFIDSVIIIDQRRKITAQTVTYYRKDRRVTAMKDVRMEDFEEDILLLCGKADYFRRTRRFIAIDNPVVILNPSDDSLKMEIKALRIEYFADESRGAAYDSVILFNKDLTATGGRAEFYREPEGVVLFRDPVVVQEENRLTGDTISIFTEDRRISRLLVEGNAQALYKTQPDTLYEEFTTAELTGKELEAFFINDKVDKAVMRYNAISVYVPAITDTLTRGTNVASGDSITLYFGDGSIRRVHIIGGAQGEYVEPKYSEGEEPVYDTTRYSASEIDYVFEESEIKLFDNGTLHYEDMVLNAGDIRYDINEMILSAKGIALDSSGEETQLPVLTQGTERLDGLKMTYNLETKKGQVAFARSEFEGGFYHGENIRQISEEEMFVSQGNYTSCDQEEYPHYHFHSDRMKMIGKDKVVAKPVILYIGEIPVIALPYYVFPIRKGRHSGFLTFEIGNFERGERFIRNLGYYWAASDYWDFETSLDFYENERTILNTGLRYNLRDRLSGGLGVNYAKETAWVNYKRNINARWRVNFSHNQIISPTISLTASGSFVSDKNYIADNIFDPEERLKRTVRSTANLTKKWKSSSLVITADQTWNLDTDVKRELLPSIRFTRSSLPIFPDPGKSKRKKRIRPWEEPEEVTKRFYHNVYFSIGSTAQNLRQRVKQNDSTFYWKGFQTVHTKSSLSSPQKIFSVLTITPGMNLTHTIYRLDWNHVTDSLGLEASKLFIRETYNLSISAKTDMYGTVYPNALGILGLRHVITPSLGYRFTPEIEENEEYRSYTGVGTTSRRSKSLSYSLNNLFQAKYLAGDNERKMDLFNMTFSGSYDYTATVRKIGNLTAKVRTSVIPHVSLDYTSLYSFYDFNDSRLPLTKPRLIRTTISSSIKGGFHPGGAEEDFGEESGEEPVDRIFGKSGLKGGEFSGVGIDFSLTHRFTLSKSATGTNKSEWLNLGLELQPTSKWIINYDCRYNVKDKRITSQTVNIGRDMHCWEGSFVWIPTGPIAGYYVRVNIKSLPDIKVEKSEGGVRGKYY